MALPIIDTILHIVDVPLDKLLGRFFQNTDDRHPDPSFGYPRKIQNLTMRPALLALAAAG